MTTVRPAAHQATAEHEQLDLVADIEPGRRLVEDQGPPLLRQRPRDPNALAFAATQRIESPGAELGRLDIGQRLADDPPVVLTLRPPGAEMGISSHRDDLARPQRERHFLTLRHEPDLARHRLARPGAGAAGRRMAHRLASDASSPSSSRAKVDFPAPLGPISAVS